MRLFVGSTLLISWAGIAQSQSSPLTCATGAVNHPVRAEGISETLGDILLNCSGGAAGTTITLNLVVFLDVGITNRLSGTNTTDFSLTGDSVSGPAPAGGRRVLHTSTQLTFD